MIGIPEKATRVLQIEPFVPSLWSAAVHRFFPPDTKATVATLRRWFRARRLPPDVLRDFILPLVFDTELLTRQQLALSQQPAALQPATLQQPAALQPAALQQLCSSSAASSSRLD